MKKLLSFSSAVLVAAAMAAPASADVYVEASIFKYKDVRVYEDIYKYKDVDINVHYGTWRDPVQLRGAAEATAIANMRNEFNKVRPNWRASRLDIERHARIVDSVNLNTGIVGVNQDVGNMVNQANLVSLALTTRRDNFTNAQAEAEQVNNYNRVFRIEGEFDTQNPDTTARINNSVNDNQGIVGVNQNAGSMNNQLNAVALAIGLDSNLALSESALGQENTNNKVFEFRTVKSDVINGSVLRNQGITQVNQSVGNMNNQGSVVAFATTVSNATIVPGSPRLP